MKESGLKLKRASDSNSLYHIELHNSMTGARILRTPPMPIEKLEPVDIDGDGVLEVMLIQSVYSSLDDEVSRRVYIYSLNKSFRALWRGSALSRPLLDAIFAKDGFDRPVLIALHTSDSFLVRNPETMERIVMAYRWNGFGFTGIRQIKLEFPAQRILLSKGKLALIQRGAIIREIPVADLTD